MAAGILLLFLAATHAAPTAPITPQSQTRPGPSPQSGSSPRSASTPPSVSVPSKTLLDTARVRRLYLDGEFDEAIDKLETSLLYGKGHSHEDSVFAFKHLGVMHAAKYDTREKGKRYMYQLLAVEPTARILDMYASDMIYMIFKNIKDEFDASQGKYDRADDLVAGGARKDSNSKDTVSPPPAVKKSAGSGKFWVGAAGVATVAAGAAAWYYFYDPKTATRRIEVE